MNKKEYKKALMEQRNIYVEHKRELDEELSIISELSYIRQCQYLNYVTHNLISSKSIIKSTIGLFIAYGIKRKQTNKDLIDINSVFIDRFETAAKELKRSNVEFDKICNAIDFIDSVDDNELEKYLSYKIN